MENQILDENISQSTEISFDERVKNILSNGYHFDLGAIISGGSNILNKNLGSYIGLFLLYLLVTIPLSFIPILGAAINNLLIAPAFTAGVFIVAHLISKNRNYEFNQFFSGFKYILQLDLMKIMTFVIIIVIALPYVLIVVGSQFMDLYTIITNARSGNVENPALILNFIFGFLWKMIPLFIIIVIVYILFSFSSLIIIFGKKGFWDALSLSTKIISKKFFSFLILFFVLILINIGGAICLVVGLLYTLPLTFCTLYSAYEQIVGTNANDISN